MGKALEKPDDTLYERDFYAWSNDQAAKLRARSHNDIDWDNLAEEIESVGRSQKKEIRHRMKVLIQHLLKWEYQPRNRCESWLSTLSEQRTHIEGTIDDSPSLRHFPDEAALWAYKHAARAASIETGLSLDVFPDSCPYTVSDMLSDDFFPGVPWSPDALVRD